MTKVIKGKGKAGESSISLTIQGIEQCTEERLAHLIPIIRELGFKKVTSHNVYLDIGDGSNVVALHSDQAVSILAGLEVPTSVIVVTDAKPTGSQGDNCLPVYIRTSTLKAAQTSNYENDRGALIVSKGYGVIGYYNSTLNFLTLTDLTHTSSGVAKLGRVLAQVKHYKDHFGIRTLDGVKEGRVVLRYPKLPTKLVIGLDPELGIIDKTNVFQSSPFTGGSMNDEIGSDGGSVEIRPAPGTPKQVVKTVKRLYEKMDKRLDKELRLVSGGGSFVHRSLGGHIHFNIPIHKELTELLDDFIGKPMKRMNGSGRGSGSGSAGTSYGKLSSVKRQPHGFEYRTPPSFVGNPELFAGVIAVAYCVASTWRTISNRGITFEYGYDDAKGVFKSAYEKLTCYKTYKKEIEDFLSYVGDEKKTIEVLDVLAAWEVRDAVVLEDITV